ncbi:MAG: hypothetical protein HOO91_09965 [Bacteroidales bacterium]|nr:hypothetical protein [Bacteroidales bacterium]
MVKEQIENGDHFDFANKDGSYGNRFTFSKGVNALGKKYVLDVHSNQQVYLQKPVIRVLEPQAGKRGRKATLSKPDVQSVSVAEYQKSLRGFILRRGQDKDR